MTEKELRASWETPSDFWCWVNGIFHFDLDACASAENTKCACWHVPYGSVPETGSVIVDGLDGEWNIYTDRPTAVWCNPGYNNVAPWLQKAYEETQKHANMTACVLTHAGLGTRWFDRYIHRMDELWILNPRIQFIAPEGIKQTSNPRDSLLWVFRNSCSPTSMSSRIFYKHWE